MYLNRSAMRAFRLKVNPPPLSHFVRNIDLGRRVSQGVLTPGFSARFKVPGIHTLKSIVYPFRSIQEKCGSMPPEVPSLRISLAISDKCRLLYEVAINHFTEGAAMHISIVGLAGSGKSTLFGALRGGPADPGTISSGVGIIDVPDDRLDVLSGMFRPKKTVYARIALSDTVSFEEGGVKSETMSIKALQQMRLSDAFLVVLRCFENGFVIDPLSEFQTIFSEFVLADMIQIETRLGRIARQSGSAGAFELQQEKDLLQACLAHVNDGRPLSALDLSDGREKRLRGYQFLSQKPIMVVLNCAEDGFPGAREIVAALRERLPEDVSVVASCAKLEAELAAMSPEDRQAFMEEYGIRESLRTRILQLARDTLGIISFLTVGDDECRAWPIKRGMCAQDAAGAIHTDLAGKFIRAETVAYEAFMEHGGFAGCKKAGLWRLEGKTYIVQDGDILCIRSGG
jgi:ribosome-binding ATPase